MKIRELIKQNMSLIIFFLLTYVDKGLYFVLPVAILYFTKDAFAYNTVEYVCSIANIIVPFFTFISCFSFFGYKEATNKPQYTEQYLLFANISTIVIGVFSLIITTVLSIVGVSALRGVSLYISIRVTFYLFIQYINCYYRLVDKPIQSLLYSIFINVFSLIVVIFVSPFANTNISLVGFFSPEIFVVLFALTCIIKLKRERLQFGGYPKYVFESIRFSWPIVVNSTAVAFVANYGKVYAYNFLSDYDMYCLSFLLRIVMIIEMAHASLVSFFSKDIYVSGFTKKFVCAYSAIMICTIVGVTGLLYLYDVCFVEQSIPIDATFGVIVLYSIFHMIGAVVEIDYSRNNQNIFIFIVSSIACLVYLFLIFVVGINGVLSISMYMFIYMLLYVILLLIVRSVLCKRK